MAFKCKFGIFEYKVMPFGLRNAPSVFQRMIDNTLVGLVGICCVAYLDDILVFSPDIQSHKQDLFKVFQALSVCNLKLKRSKCEFFQEQVTFLGGIIFKHGHAICPDKVKAIVDMAPPKDKTGVKSFLGSVNFL